MSEKRKDSKGRILRTGESQRKDGKYEYKYVDVKGVRRSVYSWKLVDTDKVPAGKRCEESLRDIEKRIEEDIAAGVDTHLSGNITFEECANTYIRSKNFKETTKINYERNAKVMRKFFGDLPIGEITDSILLISFRSMVDEGYSPGTINNYYNFTKSVLAYAFDNGYTKQLPNKGLFKKVFPSGWRSEKRKSLTKEEETAFLKFVHEAKSCQKWEPIIIFALGTGCRINEILGLQWDDCDFQNQLIHIRRGIQYISKKGNSRLVISTTKTIKSNRVIPMIPSVMQTLLRLKESGVKNTISVDGKSNFVFVSYSGTPIFRSSFDQALRRMRKEYNEIASKEGKPLLPIISPHVFRHTFCTRYCEVESNVKIIQEVMGHSRISTTLDIYTEVTENQKKDSLLAHGGYLL